jgi:low temperature requirement protein LtrA
MPPRLRTLEDAGDDRRATWLELFFDLVFVVAVAQLSNALSADRTLHGFVVFCGLFVPIWWAWVGFTFYADRFDTDDLVHPALMLSGTFALSVEPVEL